MENARTYKRNQVEYSVWHTLNTLGNTCAGGHPPKPFLTRIKRLLEIDRAGIGGSPGYAFDLDRPL